MDWSSFNCGLGFGVIAALIAVFAYWIWVERNKRPSAAINWDGADEK